MEEDRGVQTPSKQRLIAITQKALQATDLLERTTKASSGLLEIGSRFSIASRKALATVVGGSLFILVWSSAPVPALQKALLVPIAGTLGASISALAISESLEEKRKRILNEIEDRISSFELNPELKELKEPHITRYKNLARAEGTELKRLLLYSSPSPQRNALPSRDAEQERNQGI